MNKYIQSVVRIRKDYTVTLAKAPVNVNNAYLLGVNLGYAEGFAMGKHESDLKKIYSILNNSRNYALALGFDVTQLDECISLTGGSKKIPKLMDEIYSQILTVRSDYKSSLTKED